MDKIIGKLYNPENRFRFRDRNSGWTVFRVATETGIIDCTGNLPEIATEHGTELTCTGSFKMSPYGEQLNCTEITVPPPDINSAEGVLRLLQRLPGIGPKKAQQAVDHHGYEKAWYLASTDPVRIGVAPEYREKAIETAKSMTGGYAALIFLLGIGLTDMEANAITAYYTEQGIDTDNIPAEFLKDPYRIMNIDGFGFLKSDAVALKAGIGCGHPARVSAAVEYTLNDAEENNGNTWMYGQKLCNIVKNLLKNSAVKNNAPLADSAEFSAIREEVYRLEKSGKIIIDEKKRVFGKGLLDCEKTIYSAMRDDNEF